MRKIKLSFNQVEELVLKIGRFFIGPKSEKQIIAMALEVTELSDDCYKSRIRTIKEASKQFLKASPKSEEESSIARKCIILAKDEETLLGVYEKILSIMIMTGGDEIPENLMAIRKMAKFILKNS